MDGRELWQAALGSTHKGGRRVNGGGGAHRGNTSGWLCWLACTEEKAGPWVVAFA